MGSRLRDFLTTRISPRTRFWLRRKQARLRWIHKYRRLKEFRRTRTVPLSTELKFVLLDPEIDNFTFELENEDEMVERLAESAEVPVAEIARYMDEGRGDPMLNLELPRRVRWRWDVKSRPPLGRRLGWYALTRVMKPATIVETGIQHGLGSIALLRALERNAEEGHPGELISFDRAEGAGWLVPQSLYRFWSPVYESTFDALDSTLSGRSVDLLIQDLGAGYEAEMFDYETVAAHGSNPLVLLGASAHLTSALEDFARARGLTYREFRDVPHDHPHPGRITGSVTITR
jgi:hypothetical protein